MLITQGLRARPEYRKCVLNTYVAFRVPSNFDAWGLPGIMDEAALHPRKSRTERHGKPEASQAEVRSLQASAWKCKAGCGKTVSGGTIPDDTLS